jgi:hypothetical protein
LGGSFIVDRHCILALHRAENARRVTGIEPIKHCIRTREAPSGFGYRVAVGRDEPFAFRSVNLTPLRGVPSLALQASQGSFNFRPEIDYGRSVSRRCGD